MDIVSICYDEIDKKLADLNNYIRDQQQNENIDVIQTQSNIAAVINEGDKNIDKIIEQQAFIKMIIDQDGRYKSLLDTIENDKVTIDRLRKQCAKISNDSINEQKELLQQQARETEKYQMQQLKSITDDHTRHKLILEQREREREAIKKEVENEDANREAYLLDVEKNLERQLQSRQRNMPGTSGAGGAGGGLLPSTSAARGQLDDVHDPNYLELSTIDEFAPYGSTSHRTTTTRGRGGRGRGGGGGGRKRGGASGSGRA